jgi:hypothetical protein
MKSIPELLHEYETRLLKDKLLEFPGKIRRIKDELYQARRQFADAQNTRNEEEALLKSMIAAEMNTDTGKPTFSNAEARAAELVNRKKMSATYQDAEKLAQDAESKVNSLQFDLERLQDEFRAYRYVVDLTARELALMASDQLNGERENGNGERGVRNRQPY